MKTREVERRKAERRIAARHARLVAAVVDLCGVSSDEAEVVIAEQGERKVRHEVSKIVAERELLALATSTQSR